MPHDAVRADVVVVGAGATGLVAAHTLVTRADAPTVLVLEASDRLGGQVLTVDIAGSRVDVGSEALHLGNPAAAALVRELGLDQTVVGSAPGTSLLLTRKGLRPLPAGVGPTGPTQVWPVVASGALSVRGLLRAATEPVRARRKYHDDISVGQFVTMRFGREVAEVFVDPLLGNLHSGEVRALSLRATAPQLKPIAQQGTSLLWRALRKPAGRPAPGDEHPLPVFASWPGGLSTLIDQLAASVTSHGGSVRTRARVTGLTHLGPVDDESADDDRWRLDLADGTVVTAGQVIVAITGPALADLVQPVAPRSAAALRWVKHASVATVVLGYDRDAVVGNKALNDFNGVLLTSSQTRTVKAATNLTRKWPMLSRSAYHLVRLSVGRSTTSIADDLDDDEMIAAAGTEFGQLIGLEAPAVLASVYRWPLSMPQLGVGHLDRRRVVAEELAGLPGLHLAGCTIDGLGLTSTIASGRRAAADAAVRTSHSAVGTPITQHSTPHSATDDGSLV